MDKSSRAQLSECFVEWERKLQLLHWQIKVNYFYSLNRFPASRRERGNKQSQPTEQRVKHYIGIKGQAMR